MALDPETYVDVYVTIARAMFSQQLPIIFAAEVAYYAAQPTTNATKHDILDELRAELYDWIPSDLAALKECELISLRGFTEDKPRCAQLIAMAVDGGWHGGLVHASRVNINEAMEVVSKRYLPDDVDQTSMFCASDNIDFTTAASKFRENVENEISKFREELDFLYPYPEEGGNP